MSDDPGPRREAPSEDAESAAAVAASKRIARALRHRPQSLGQSLDSGGWVEIDRLLAGLAEHGEPVSRARFDRIVAGTDKRRYEVRAGRVRAAQGHSIPVELGRAPSTPPELLYHGTVERALPAIRREGLRPMSRRQVHLSAEPDTARTVGARRGRPVVLVVAAGEMAAAGIDFVRADNGVWLVDAVAPQWLRRLDGRPW